MVKRLALFDFDGTLTSKDTMLEFIRFVNGSSSLNMSFVALSPILVLQKLGLYSRKKAKEKLLSWHFRGMEADDLNKKAEEFCANRLPNLLRDKALGQLQHHRMQGHEVLVISASLDIWLKPWLEYQKLNYIVTKGEIVDGKITGRIVGENMHGEEKAKAIRERYNLSEFETIYAYGDTSGDKPMLKLAHVPRYKPFRGKLPTWDKQL